MWHEAQPHVDRQQGGLVLNDTMLNKPYAKELVSSHWSGKHQRVVKGINLITMLWIENDGHLPCYERTMTSRMTKMSENAHFRSLRQKAKERGFQPACVLFDS